MFLQTRDGWPGIRWRLFIDMMLSASSTTPPRSNDHRLNMDMDMLTNIIPNPESRRHRRSSAPADDLTTVAGIGCRWSS